MGLKTFADFKSDVAQACGKLELIDAGTNEALVGESVNRAYFDLATSVDFEALDAETTLATVVAQAYVVTPTTALAVKLVRNTTDSVPLGWLPKTEFFRRTVATGTPTYWTRHGLNIQLLPTPNAIKNLLVIYKKTPAILTGTDVTVIPPSWDQAIFLLGTSYELMRQGDEARAAAWHARAGLYIATRFTEADLQNFESGLGGSLTPNMKQMLEAQAGVK